jgi:uncharacterized protein YfaS (alpha-2-macroglobulin family)
VYSGEPDGKLLSFSPSLKGAARWMNSNTLEFIPEEGGLKAGTVYNVTFNLGKVVEVERKLAKFEFSFRVAEPGFNFSTSPIKIDPDGTVTVEGTLSFSEKIQPETAKKTISGKLGNQTVEAVIEGDDNYNYKFSFKGIKRTDESRQLLIKIDGKPAESDRTETISVNIPAKDRFSFLEYQTVTAPGYGVTLIFSDLISESQNLKGLITVDKVSGYKLQVSSNQLTVYFTDKPEITSVNISIDKALKSASGETLAKSETVNISVEPLKPQVEILTAGVIMPNTGKTILPFRAVALKAVDLKVIRIYESNIMMYLQSQSLGDKYAGSLRRAGRLVYRQTLRLDTDPSESFANWKNCSLDLSRLVNQRPGDIYRIELSFKKEYSAYPCDGSREDESAQNQGGVIDLTSTLAQEPSVAESDDTFWDTPNEYFYDNYDMDVNWDEYEWSEKDNPCNATYFMQAEHKAVTNLLVSDLGIIAKSNSDNTVWLSVSNLTDTKPAGGVNVTVYNYQLQPMSTAATDQNGFAVLHSKNKPFLAVASLGSQKSYVRLVDGENNMLSRFDVGGVELKKGLKGYIYGERGVWRPGDTLHISFMLDDRNHNIPSSHPVTLEIYNPQGQFYKKLVSTNGQNGLYTFNVPTKQDDPTGLWNSYVKTGGATFHKSLRIETVKPNRLKINLNLPPVLEASKGAASAEIHSAWLTGAAARNLSARMELLLTKTSTPFKGYEDFVFNNPASDFQTSRADVFDGKLNDNGDVRFDMKIPKAENAPGMLLASAVTRVFEPGGDASIFTRTVPFSPYPSYVGIKFNQNDKDRYLQTDEDHVFDIVTLDAEGRPVSKNNLEYYIYRIGWSWWWEKQSQSFASYFNNTSFKPLFTGKLNTTNGKGSIKFRINYPDWGRYLVYVKDPSGGHATGDAVLVDWPSWRGRSAKADPDGIKMLSFALDKESYNAGETVTVTIPAVAYGGSALVALENGAEVLQREWVSLEAGKDTKYMFTLTAGMAPNIYVHISLLQPHAAATDLPIRLYGVMPVFVSNRESVLNPVITMAEVLRPESSFEVKVKEKSGKPMTYTLAVVDDGLLDLTNFSTPDPWNEFYAREALGIRTWDMYDYVMGAYTGSMGSLFGIGGDEEIKKSSAKANRFKPVVLFEGPVTLKAGEEKKHTLQLPSYAGSVRVMVVAGQDATYGSADKTAPVRAPLMLLSSLPRVLSINEKIELPVNIFAMEDNVRDVTVKVETTGKLKVAGGNTKTLTFSKPGDDIVYFPMETGSDTGIENVTVTATGGGHTSKETIEIDVRNPNTPVLTHQSKILEKGQSVEYDYSLDASFDGNWVKVEMSRIPSIDINARYDFLINYQYKCSEQLVSAALPLLFLSDFKELTNREKEVVSTNVREAIRNLYFRQLSNGGFVYWPGNSNADDWISSYAGTFLVHARERGYEVSSGVLTKWINYQKNVAQATYNTYDRTRYSYYQSDLARAYCLYSLALANAPDLGAMNRLKEDKDLSRQARWRLAAAYALAGKKDAANELVFNAATTVEPYSPDNSTYGSSGRDEAMILETLVLLDRKEEAFRQAQRIAGSISKDRYYSTQSTACALAAMGQFASKMSGQLDFEWTLNGKASKVKESRKPVFISDIPVKPAQGKVRVVNNDGGVLYTSISSKTCPLVDDRPAMDENIRLDVKYTDIKGTAIDVSKLMQGTDFYVVIRVSNTGSENYNNVALTYMLPSGWEIFNERMIPGQEDAAVSRKVSYQDIRDDRVFTFFDLGMDTAGEIKIRLQSSYTGNFTLPAVLCEAMYDPSTFSRTKAGRVEVVR